MSYKLGDPILESKVEDFLARLRQDSLNYSMPQAKSFQGASFHLSLSGDDLLQVFILFNHYLGLETFQIEYCGDY